MKILLAVLVLALAGGCASAPKAKTVTLTHPFDKIQADRLLRPGPNTIKVNAFLRQEGGGVVTCAGQDVDLVPATEMARERITALYGSALGGFRRADAVTVNFAGIDPEYAGKQKNALCSSEGRVTFENVTNGDFYVTTEVVWSAQGKKQGGFLAKRVTVGDGEVLDLVLSD
jgi:hypothetical protein